MENLYENEFADDAQYDDATGGGGGGFDDFNDFAKNLGDDAEFVEGPPDDARKVDDFEQFLLQDKDSGMNDGDDLYEDDTFDDDKSDDLLSSPSESRVFYEPDLPQLDSSFGIPVSVSDNGQGFDKHSSAPLIAGVVLAVLVGLILFIGRRNSKSMDKQSYMSAPSSPVVKRDLVV
jgi:hypothetical protein